MADNTNTNPFDCDVDPEITEEQQFDDTDNDIVPMEQSESSWDSIAHKLLRENFMLTALEFHTELIESGRELPRLRDYFSNPGNFERTRDDLTSPGLPRTSSIQTFDSLDFARYSDDGAGQVDERVAVLEFELRKAQETIKSLRASLTKEAENECTENVAEGFTQMSKDDPIRPLDKRALNYLVNEYLLMNNYKLTSVTFSEENEDQDFEDWDDVGLNIPRPPDLLHLYKDYGSHAIQEVETNSVECWVNFEEDRIGELEQDWITTKEHLDYQIKELEDQVVLIQSEKVDLQNQLSEMCRLKTELQNSLEVTKSLPQQNGDVDVDLSPIKLSKSADIDQNTTMNSNHGDDIDSNSVEDSEMSRSDLNESKHSEDPDERNSDFVVIDTPNISKKEEESEEKENADARHLPPTFKKALLDVCFHVSKDNRIVSEVSQIAGFNKDNVVLMLGRCLPHIVPNVLLAKREELIPLILCTAMLHPDSKERDKLLNILFNLIKKPDDEQRQMILTGCVAFAQHVGQARLMEELLPQCWEQISHKYAERRILVAEACGALASYLPNEILSSLVLSMLQQMLSDDKDEEVREAVVRSLGLLFGFICDTDKFSQGFELLQTALKDNSERVITAAQQVFLPAFAVWAQELDKLEHNLINTILKDLEELCALAAQKASNSVTIPLNEGRFLLLMMALQELVPFLFISMVKSAPFVGKISEVLGTAEPVDASRFPKPSSPLSDLKTVVGGGRELSALMYLYENHISQEWFEPWDNFNWVVNNLIPRLIEISMGAGLSAPRITTCQCKCFFKICRTFGKTFTEKKIRPKFIELMMLTDEHVEYQAYANAKQTSVTTCIVPVYAGGVLSAFNSEEDRQQLTQFLQEMLTMVSVYQAPLDSIKAAFMEISANPSNHELLLTVLWEGVVHTSAQVRSTAARLFELLVKGVSENLVSTRVFPALVTLGNDPEISVRTSTIPALGAIIENINLREMLDRVYMQFLTFMDDPAYKDEHNIQTELIRTLARVGPNAEPRFRDEFILPRLAAMASANNNLTTEGRKRDIALLLFEAYSAMSCCFINDQLVQEAMVPGLRCLKHDVAQIAPEHEEVVSSMIKDYESKMDFTASPAYAAAGNTPISSEDMKSRMMSRIKDTTSKANLSTIFTRKK
ncbi:RAB11-binding protein RELCH homolog [Ylistrum balloti]|uniref:RAB11-binding protein RELCH homolog n=1 Tax=Ylistrum balloti TaxID=509963 RepID=UPI002905A978|nr:RAB11-binding protein RELCH homolog [Ylistrum balloti]